MNALYYSDGSPIDPRTCPTCSHVHTPMDATAVGRFRHDSPIVYRARSGGLLRKTREAAVADECANRVRLVNAGVAK